MQSMKCMRVLGIETSCDETGVGIYDGDRGLAANLVYSQVALHAKYGGVVPELASRDHVRKILPLVREALDAAGLERSAIDAIAYTAGPGLIGALLVGAALGRSLAWAWGIPALGVHHMEGHLLAPLLQESGPRFPFVALLVSGGHTQLVDVAGVGRYRILGESLDDAAGEAFDKTAKLLELPYPGGPSLARLAERGDPHRFRFPRPMTDRPGVDFSFSGLKTFTLRTLAEELPRSTDPQQTRADIARAFEEAIVDTLVIKCRRALRESGHRRLILAGGVSANRRLRQRVEQMVSEEGGEAHFPPSDLCTDNGAMIAFAGWHRLRAGQREPLAFSPKARWSMLSLEPVDADQLERSEG